MRCSISIARHLASVYLAGCIAGALPLYGLLRQIVIDDRLLAYSAIPETFSNYTGISSTNAREVRFLHELFVFYVGIRISHVHIGVMYFSGMGARCQKAGGHKKNEAVSRFVKFIHSVHFVSMSFPSRVARNTYDTPS